jgi:hypothetical protein
MFDAAFLIAIKKYQWLFWYLLYLVPFVNFVFMIVFKIYLGVKGRTIAATSTYFQDERELRGFMKGIDHAGKVLFFIMLAVLVIWLVLVALFGAASIALPGLGNFNFGTR